MRRRLIIGYVLLALSVALVLTVLAVSQDPAREALLGGALLLGAAGLATLSIYRTSRKLEDVNRPADEAYEAGHDDGYEKGWRDHAQRALRIVNMQERRRKGGDHRAEGE